MRIDEKSQKIIPSIIELLITITQLLKDQKELLQ